jgi:hypothetical protein
MSDEELDEVEDLRAFGQRIGEIAMDGFLEDASLATEEAPSETVRFSDEMPDPRAGFEATDVFEAGHGRIFAVFPTPRDHADRVLLKWTRVDQPEILLLSRQSIRPEDEHGFVWLDRRPSWLPGEYRVDVYGGDDEMRPVASGRYVIQ